MFKNCWVDLGSKKSSWVGKLEERGVKVVSKSGEATPEVLLEHDVREDQTEDIEQATEEAWKYYYEAEEREAELKINLESTQNDLYSALQRAERLERDLRQEQERNTAAQRTMAMLEQELALAREELQKEKEKNAGVGTDAKPPNPAEVVIVVTSSGDTTSTPVKEVGPAILPPLAPTMTGTMRRRALLNDTFLTSTPKTSTTAPTPTTRKGPVGLTLEERLEKLGASSQYKRFSTISKQPSEALERRKSLPDGSS